MRFRNSFTRSDSDGADNADYGDPFMQSDVAAADPFAAPDSLDREPELPDGVLDYSPTDPELLAGIKTARMAQGLYEDDIGLQYGVSAEWIHRWEAGEWTLPPGTVKSIARDLGVQMPPVAPHAGGAPG